jgi:hypothetical protein
MELDRLNNTVDDFIDNNRIYIETLPKVVEYSKNIFSMYSPNDDKEWSRNIDLNESLKIIYLFLLTIDKSMAEQFVNIINSKDENNNLYVNILPKSKYPDGHDEVRNGSVYVYYDNSPNDVFVILHEMLHKMNECNIIDNNQLQESFTRKYFGETVSILGELMLGNFMVENGFITKGDFEKRKAWRTISTKENARDIIIENELVNLRLNGKSIDYNNLVGLIDKYSPISFEYEILNDEKNDLRRINCILKSNGMNIPQSQRYVIAYNLSNEIIKRKSCVDDFLKLHYAIGNPNSNLADVYNEVILKQEFDVK